MNYEVFLEDKISYLAEIARQMTFSSKRVVFVIDYKYHEHFIETWKKIDKQISPLDKFYKGTIRDNSSQNNQKPHTDFVDFIENLIMIDLLEDSFVFDNFVEHRVKLFFLIIIFYINLNYHIFTSRNNFDVLGNYSYKPKNNFELFFLIQLNFFLLSFTIIRGKSNFSMCYFFFPSNNC